MVLLMYFVVVAATLVVLCDMALLLVLFLPLLFLLLYVRSYTRFYASSSNTKSSKTVDYNSSIVDSTRRKVVLFVFRASNFRFRFRL